MPFVEHGLVRRVLERALDFLEFGEIVSCDIAQHDFRAKPAGAAILDEAGLPFHVVLIPYATLSPCSSQKDSGGFALLKRLADRHGSDRSTNQICTLEPVRVAVGNSAI